MTERTIRGLLQPTNNNAFRSVTIASFALNWAAAGAHPLVFHLVNLLLHTAVVVVLYLVLRSLLDSVPNASTIAFAAALLFAVHPIHTEAVASIVGRSELLAAGFLLAAWLLHLNDKVIAALLCFLLALLSKESAVAFVPLGGLRFLP
jgi:protein O-mannosyl-transferase